MRDKDQQKQSASRHGPAFWKEEKERGNLGLKLMSKMGWQEGQGLGKDGKGNTEILKAKKKTNFSGVGLSKDDPFAVAQAMFSNVLAKLQPVVAGTEVDTPVAKEEEPAYNSTKAVTAFVARQGLYGRFKKAKDAKNYSSSHMAEILGKKEVKETAPTTTETEFKSDIFVKTSNVSMRDYFANKIKTSSKKVTKFQTASGGGFSLDFQADYYDQMMDKSIHGKKGLGFSQNSGKELKGSGSRITLTNGDSHTTSISTTSFLLSPEDSKVDHNDEQLERRGLGLGFQSSSDASPMATTSSSDATPQTSSEIIVDSNKSKKKKKSKKDKSKEETKVSLSTLSVTPELEKPKKQKKNKKSKTNPVAPVVDGTVTSTPVLIGDSQVSSKKKKKKKEVNGLASVTETVAVETPKSLKKRKREQQVLEEASLPPSVVVLKKKKKDKKNKLTPTSTDSTSTPITTTTTTSTVPVEVETKTLKKKKSKKSSQSIETTTTTTVVEVLETTTKKKKSKKLKTVVENSSNTLSTVSSVAIISSIPVSSVETVKMKKKRKKDSVSAIPDTTTSVSNTSIVEPVQKKKKKSKKEKIVEQQQPIVTPPTEVVKKKKKKTKVQNAA